MSAIHSGPELFHQHPIDIHGHSHLSPLRCQSAAGTRIPPLKLRESTVSDAHQLGLRHAR